MRLFVVFLALCGLRDLVCQTVSLPTPDTLSFTLPFLLVRLPLALALGLWYAVDVLLKSFLVAE